MGDKHVALLWGKRLSLLGNKQIAFIGVTSYPYWGTNRLPLLGDKQVAPIDGQTRLSGAMVVKAVPMLPPVAYL